MEKKRKGGPTNESFARSRRASDGDDRPAKRPRPDEKEGNTTTAKIPHIPKISKVREEEFAFPRGGASVLSPLEHKQIQIEATRDVLFEQQSGKSSKVDADGQQDEDIQSSVRKSKSISKKKKGKHTTEPEEEDVKIESLSYKVCLKSILSGVSNN